jgi:acetolactate synthase regulatory subunit
MALALLAVPSLSLASTEADHTPPVVRMSSPARLSPARFVVLRVADAGSGLSAVSLHVNGTRVGVGDVAPTGSVRFRALAGWEPRRRYRIRMTATDRAGNLRRFTRSIRARNFGIVTVAVRDLTKAHAAGGCGYVHLRPRRFRLGTAPLALGDSVMLGAAWRLTHAGFETDTLCGRSPRTGLDVLRGRRHRGTLPSVVVVALGSNAPMTSRDIAAMLQILGPRRKLMLVTQMRHWRQASGGAIRRAARRHPARIKLIDWSRLARRHPRWLWGDGTHLRPTGLPGYTRLIHRAAWSKLRGRYIRR